MASASPGRPGRDEYLVWDLSGEACSILLNFELADSLKKLARRRSSREINGILLGRIQVGEWNAGERNRTLVTIEDCHVIPLPEQIPEHLEYWRGEEQGRLSAVGLVRVANETRGAGPRADPLADPRDESIAFFNRHFAGWPGVVLLIEPARGALLVGRLLWSSSGAVHKGMFWAEIPFDSAKLRGGGFTILQGSPVAEYSTAPQESVRGALRKWAWAPLAAALLCIITITFWPAYRPMAKEVAVQYTVDREMAPEAQPSGPRPSLQPGLQPIPAPTSARAAEVRQPPARLNREGRERRPNPPTVTVELRAAPDSLARRLIGRVPGLPLARRFRSKDTANFIAPTPIVQVKPASPIGADRAFPGEWQVNLRVTIDKSGNIVRTTLLNRGANREFVDLAKNAINRWRFEPARLRNRRVPSALDVTFRFHHSLQKEGERAKR